MTIEEQDNTNLQTSFDLLGEIIKYNKRTLLIFESAISDLECGLLCEKIVSHIVDSNVFIRSLIISAQYFHKVTISFRIYDLQHDQQHCTSNHVEYIPFVQRSKLLSFITASKDMLLRKLIASVHPTTISQTSREYLLP